jgi:hypothetical protein
MNRVRRIIRIWAQRWDAFKRAVRDVAGEA